MNENFFLNRFYHFESPWFLLLFPLLLVALTLALTRKSPTVIVSSVQPYLSSVTRNQRIFTPIKLPLIFEGIGLVLLLIALTRPQHGIEETITRAEGIDMMLALDLSGSMESYDVPGYISSQKKLVQMLNSKKLKPRIEIAKEEVKRFIDKRPNDRIGLIAFAANTYTVCPPTLDHTFLKGHLDRLKTGMLPDGTGIAAPIAISTNRLKDSKAKRRVMVLFTDGDNNVEAKVTPLQASKIAESFELIIHTVGIGSTRAFVIRPGFFGRQQMVNVQSSFNQELLDEISTISKGRYFRAEDADGFKKVMQSIDELEKTSLEQPTYIDYKDLYKNWLQCGILALCIGFLLENSLSLKIP